MLLLNWPLCEWQLQPLIFKLKMRACDALFESSLHSLLKNAVTKNK